MAPPAEWDLDFDWCLISVGFDRKSPGQSIESLYAGVVEACLQRLSPRRGWIYISTTGVYAQQAGERLDETSPCDPVRPGGVASLRAERLLAESGRPCWLLRMAGIYGPARVPRAQALVDAQPITAYPDSWLNLIHVRDAAEIIVAAGRTTPQNGEVLNVSDGSPVRRQDFYDEAARRLRCAAPIFHEPPSAADTRGGRHGKIVINDRLRQRLAPQFLFPSYREGLADALQTQPSSDR